MDKIGLEAMLDSIVLDAEERWGDKLDKKTKPDLTTNTIKLRGVEWLKK